MNTKKQNIGILTFPISEAGKIPLSNLVDILYPLSNDLYLITGNDGYDFFKEEKRIHTYGIWHESGANAFTRIIKYIYTQLKISYKLAKVARKVDIWIFFIGGTTLLLPMLTAKLLRKTVVLSLAESATQNLISANDNLFKPMKVLSKINCTLSNRIILHSPNLIKEWNLERYEDKIYIAHEYFLDFDKFKIKKKFDERDNLVGYMGRLSEEKGILNFVKAIPEIIEKENEIKILIGGDGQLRDKIEKLLNEEKINNKVELTGWIPHDKIPDYLNELKLLVIPSYTESGPIIALEAMACGTPILATRVGHVLNMTEDGITGVILENNSPECIAENVIKVLKYPDLDIIVKNARELVKKEFTYEVAVEGYTKILESF